VEAALASGVTEYRFDRLVDPAALTRGGTADAPWDAGKASKGVSFPVAVPDASRSAGRAASSPAVWCQSTASLSCPDRADLRA
jgi:hypothetical protein